MIAHIARQAIYNADKNVVAYELLFRDGEKNCFPDISPDEATSTILADSHLSIGLENITSNKVAFINFHQDTLIHRFPTTLDKKKTVIEIVETIQVTEELIDACKHVRNLGYSLALDDYDFSNKWDTLIPIVQYVKVEAEFIHTDNPQVKKKIAEFQQLGIKLVAEKVETNEEFEQFKSMGFGFFQGYFLSKPEMIQHKNLDASTSSVMELVGISSKADFDFNSLNEIFEKDVGLTFKLMRFINNPTFNKREKIASLEHALKYLGSLELKKFIALLAIANLKGSKPIDLLVMSLVRGQFCKLQADMMKMNDNPPSSFIMGLFSLVDVLIDMPMQKVTKTLPFSDDVTQALCTQDTSTLYGAQLKMCIAFEKADFKTITQLSEELRIEETKLYNAHYQAMVWAEEMKKCAG